MRLSSPFEKPGFFWLPSHPDQHYPGNLHISEAGEIRLRIVHYAPPRIDARLLHSKTPIGDDPPRIVGIVDNKHGDFAEMRCRRRSVLFVANCRRGRIRITISRWGCIHWNFISGRRVRFAFQEWSVRSRASANGSRSSGFRPELNANSEPAKWSLHYAQPDNIPLSSARRHSTDVCVSSVLFSSRLQDIPTVVRDLSTDSRFLDVGATGALCRILRHLAQGTDIPVLGNEQSDVARMGQGLFERQVGYVGPRNSN